MFAKRRVSQMKLTVCAASYEFLTVLWMTTTAFSTPGVKKKIEERLRTRGSITGGAVQYGHFQNVQWPITAGMATPKEFALL